MNYLYQIRIQGHLVDDWSEWFAGLQITRLAVGETQLVGWLDQTALHGVLARIRDLNLLLLEVKQISATPAANQTTGLHSGKEAQSTTQP